MTTIDVRQHVHTLANQLPPAQLTVIEGLLSVMIDPVAHALRNAPIEDRLISEEEEQAVARSKKWFEHNPGTPFEDVVIEMGFTMDQMVC